MKLRKTTHRGFEYWYDSELMVWFAGQTGVFGIVTGVVRSGTQEGIRKAIDYTIEKGQ